MVARDDHKVIAKDRGSLALELYVLESKLEKSPDKVKHDLPAHLDFRRDTNACRVPVRADPLSYAIADSMERAELIAYRDGSMAKTLIVANVVRMRRSGARQLETLVAGRKVGEITVNLDLSTARVQLD